MTGEDAYPTIWKGVTYTDVRYDRSYGCGDCTDATNLDKPLVTRGRKDSI